VTGYIALLTTQVTCAEFSKCYEDVNICLWTNGSLLTQSEAQPACRQRYDNSILVRITDSNVQSKLADFRRFSGNLLSTSGFWIDANAKGINDFHWIDDSPLAGWFKSNCESAIYLFIFI